MGFTFYGYPSLVCINSSFDVKKTKPKSFGIVQVAR